MRAQRLLVAVLALALLGGCKPDVQQVGGDAAPAGSVSQTALPSTAAAASAQAPSTTPAASASQAKPCQTLKLSGEIDPFAAAGAAGGQHTAALGLTNTGPVACTMTGYPNLQLLAFNDKPRATKVTHSSDSGARPVTVTLAPGQRAWTTIAWFFTPSADEADQEPPCAPQPIAARVTPPGEHVSLRIAGDFGRVCGHGQIFVGPMSLTRPQ
jgi:hypothetical protein